MKHKIPSTLKRIIPDHVLAIPPYVPGKPIEELYRQFGIQGARKMASNENPLGPSPAAVEAMQAHLSRSHVYPESSGPVLRAAIAKKLLIPEDAVILGNGSDEIMQMVSHVFIRPGEEAIIPNNSFSMYRIVVEAFGGRPVMIPLRDYALDLQAMAAAVTVNTRVVFLAVPNSPTGTVISRSGFEEFLSQLGGARLIVVLDEAYREYVRDKNCPHGLDYLGSDPPVLVLRTFSKIYGLAGLRIGYGLAEPWLIDILNRVRPPFNTNAMAQAAAVAALGDSPHIERTLQVTHQGLHYLSDELKGMALSVIPSQANFVTFRVGDNARRIYEGLLMQGVIVRHLATFGMEDCIRVTVGDESDNRMFVAAMKTLVGQKGDGFLED